MDTERSFAYAIDLILFSIVIGLCSGIVCGAFVAVPLLVLVLVGMVGTGAALAVGKGRTFICVSMFLFAALIGIGRMEQAKPDLSQFAADVGTKVTLTGIIDDPAEKSSGIQCTLQTDSGVNILVSTTDYIDLAYGDEVSVTGKLQLPQNFTTDQGNEFDYVSYLYKDDIIYQMSYAKVAVLSHGHGNWLVARPNLVEDWFLASFNRVLSVREADLEGGLVLGSKENIDKQFRDDLVTTGTIHIIALSGYNVSIVANALRDLFVDVMGLSTHVAAGAGAICIVLFVVMTGLQSSAIRAGVMALISIFARTRGRTYNAFRALVAAGIVMILWNPKYLVYDVSFQLSFLATLGIIFITPVLEQKFARVPRRVLWIVPLREAMSVTLGAQISVLPFILYKMGTLSLIALPANILILPAVPYAMGFGTLAGLLGSFSIPLASPATLITHLLLEYITGLVTFFAGVPYAAVFVHQFPLWLCLILYGVLILVLFHAWNAKRKGAA